MARRPSVGQNGSSVQLCNRPFFSSDDAVFWGEEEGENENEGLAEDDATAGRGSSVEADEDAGSRRKNGGYHREEKHFIKAISPKMRDATGGDEHGDNEDDANRLQGGDDGEGEESEQEVVEEFIGQGHDAGLAGIKTDEQ